MKNLFIKNKAITLVALVVTIVVLLVLAGASINMLLGENGIITKAKDAKQATIVAQEEEQIKIAYASAGMNNLDGTITETDFQNELDLLAGRGNTTVKLVKDETFSVVFENTQNKYKVNKESVKKVDSDEAETTPIYVKRYIDGTVIFSSTDYTDSSRIVEKDYGDISNENYIEFDENTRKIKTETVPPWIHSTEYHTGAAIRKIIIYDEIFPKSTAGWFIGIVPSTDEFYGCEMVNLNNINTSNLTNTEAMFYNCSEFTNFDLSNFDMSKVTNMNHMFAGCEKLTSIDFSNCNISKVENISNMFEGCTDLTSVNFDNCDMSKLTNVSSMFEKCNNLTKINLDMGNVTDASSMFKEAGLLDGIDFSKLNTSKVENMSGMFANATILDGIDLSKLNTSNVTNMSNMFAGCTIVSYNDGPILADLDLSKLNTSNVTNMSNMFAGCTILSYNDGPILADLDLSKLDTSKVTNMSDMFALSYSFRSINLANCNMNNVTDMSGMFYGCRNLTNVTLGANNASNLNLMCMFSECTNLTNVDFSKFNTSNIKSMNLAGMFRGCNSLTKADLSNWNIPKEDVDIEMSENETQKVPNVFCIYSAEDESQKLTLYVKTKEIKDYIEENNSYVTCVVK